MNFLFGIVEILSINFHVGLFKKVEVSANDIKAEEYQLNHIFYLFFQQGPDYKNETEFVFNTLKNLLLHLAQKFLRFFQILKHVGVFKKVANIVEIFLKKLLKCLKIHLHVMKFHPNLKNIRT